MELSPTHRLRQIAGENIIIAASGPEANLTRVIALNDTAARLWQEFEEREFTPDDVALFLYRTYDVTLSQAAADATAWIALLRTHGLLCD